MSEFHINGDGFGCYAHIKTDFPERVHVYKVVELLKTKSASWFTIALFFSAILYSIFSQSAIATLITFDSSTPQ